MLVMKIFRLTYRISSKDEKIFIVKYILTYYLLLRKKFLKKGLVKFLNTTYRYSNIDFKL